MAGAAIEIKGVEKKFGDVAAVAGLDLMVGEGKFVALLGPSGCGKTTTLRMIAGLEHPTAGDILVKGRRVNDVPVHKRNFGMVFQNLALFPHKTVFDNIAFGLKYRNVPKADVAKRVKTALDVVRLPGMEGRLPAQLSGGQQQRVAVARAIVIEPDLLLFDEPLSALDAGLREEMRFELKRIQRNLGITTVFVTHDQAEALSMADKVVVMSNGKVEQEGSPDEVYSRPTSEFVARFFGQVNELTGKVVGRREGVMDVALAEGTTVQVAHDGPTSDTVKLLLRSERIRAAKPGMGEAGASIIKGTVASSDYLGLMVRYVVNAAGTEIAVMQPKLGPLLGTGEPVDLSVQPNAWMIL